MPSRILNLMMKDFLVLRHQRVAVASICILDLFAALVSSSNVATSTLVGLMALLSYSTFSFSLDLKYEADRFFASLAVKRRDMVLARYGNIAFLTIFFLAFAYLLNALLTMLHLSTVQPLPVGFAAFYLVIVVAVFALYLPLYFKFGFLNSRYLVFLIYLLPGVVVMVLIGLKGGLRPEYFAITDVWSLLVSLSTVASLFIIIAAVAVFGVSSLLAVRFFERKDL